MKTKIAIITTSIIALSAVAAWELHARGPDESSRAATKGAGPTGGASDRPVEISMLYSSEKADWLEAAQKTFAAAHPEIRVTLRPRGSLDAARAVLDGTEKPTVLSPADSLVLNMLASDWKTKGRPPLTAQTGEDAPRPLVVTPMVFVMWEDRAEALTKSGGEVSWRTLHKAVTAPNGWVSVGGKPEWGFVKIGHTDPTRSNSGLEALYMMALTFHDKDNVEVGDLLSAPYQQFTRDLERGVPQLEASTGTFMTEMIRFGPSKFDVALVYENLALSQIDAAQGRWGALRIYYPKRTVWSDHPAAILNGDWVTPEQRAAARLWLAHLGSREVQESARTWGFRPADPSVPVRTADGSGPFERHTALGVKLDLPAAGRAPDGAVVRNMLVMWSRVAAPR